MGNKKLTNKEIRNALDDIYKALAKLDDNCQFLNQKDFQIANAFNLYLKYCGEETKFTKFVKEEIDKSEKTRSTDKKGA